MTTIRVSVIVPTYRRPGPLAACLAALAVQDIGTECFEVIVVDDGSGAPPHALITSMQSAMSVRLVERVNGGPGAARNTGAQHAHGALLAFTDDDCAPEPGWLSALVEAIDAQPHAAVGGRIDNALQANVFAEASQALGTYLYAYFARKGRERRRFFTTNNLCVRKAQFDALGGFDTANLADTAEDRDFSDRWRARGWPLRYAPTAVVHHAHDMGLRGFCAQHFNYGQGALYFHQAGGRNASAARRPEPPTFYLGMLVFPFVHYTPARASAVVMLLSLSQVAYVSGYVTERVWPRKRVGRARTADGTSRGPRISHDAPGPTDSP